MKYFSFERITKEHFSRQFSSQYKISFIWVQNREIEEKRRENSTNERKHKNVEQTIGNKVKMAKTKINFFEI